MDITELTVHELQEKLKNKELTVTQITKAYVDRINEKEKDVKAFVTTLTEEATNQAEQIEQKINNGEITELSEDEKTVTGIVIPPVDENGNFTKEEVINNFNLYLEWYDKEDNVLDNQNDVLISKLENSIATVKLKVTITQVKDDEINEIP